MSPARSNRSLPPLPSDAEIVAALAAARDGDSAFYDRHGGMTAQQLAWRLGVEGARRLGNGATAGSWSGRMAPALRLAPRLRALAHAGVIVQRRDWADVRSRWVYALPHGWQPYAPES